MPHTLAEIAAALGAESVGDTDFVVARPRQPREAGVDDLALAMDAAFAPEIAEGSALAAVLWKDADWQELGLKAAVLVGRHRYAMSGITEIFDLPYEVAPGFHPSAIIDPSAEIASDVRIGPLCVIGAGVKIGRGSVLHDHVSVYRDASIGADAMIHAGVRISARVSIGDRVILQPNAVVGADGFSFVTPEPSAVEVARSSGGKIADAKQTAAWTRINSIGSVVIGDDVEVGASTAIDRGTVSDTRIGNGTKIDNLVQIAHNVQIGETCLVCGHVGIAGSTVIGDRVVLGGSAGVADHVTIGSDVIVGGASGVASSVKSGSFVMGFPAQDRADFFRDLKARRRLPKMAERLSALEKRVP
jgi:UDP-3-O-[3-hydroxymyristoyl] glucosamine N-acyltransferase